MMWRAVEFAELERSWLCWLPQLGLRRPDAEALVRRQLRSRLAALDSFYRCWTVLPCAGGSALQTLLPEEWRRRTSLAAESRRTAQEAAARHQRRYPPSASRHDVALRYLGPWEWGHHLVLSYHPSICRYFFWCTCANDDKPLCLLSGWQVLAHLAAPCVPAAAIWGSRYNM